MLKKPIWSLVTQEQFLLRLGQLYRNGYSIEEAMRLYEIHANEIQKRDIELMLTKLRQGNTLHAVLHEFQFHELVLSLLYFAQQHGDLGESLTLSGELLKRSRLMRENIWGKLKYPIFLGVVVFIMLFFVKVVLIPQFQQLFSQMNVQHTLLIEILTNFIIKLPNIIVFTLLLVLLLFSTYPLWANKLSSSTKIHLLLKIPLINKITSYFFTYFFTNQLSQLLHVGLSINDSLEVMGKQRYSTYFQGLSERITAALRDGNSLESAIKNEVVFDDALSIVIVHGQKNGELATALKDYSEIVLQSLEQRIEKFISSLQPLLLTCIGVFVMMLYLSIFIPMFQLIGGL